MQRCRPTYRAIHLLLLLLALPMQALAGFYYQVKQGDAMSTLAGRFGISTAALAQSNRLSPNSRLVAGSRLWIPSESPARNSSPARSTRSSRPTRPVSAPVVSQSSRISSIPPGWRARPAEAAAPSPAPDRPVTASMITDNSYSVRRGDSLWKISNDHGMTVDQLAALNGLDKNRPLEVGQVLRVSGDSQPDVQDIPGGGLGSPPAYTPPEPSRQPAPVIGSARPSRMGYIWPVEGRVIRTYTRTSEEKYMGIDVAVPVGTEIRAARDGTVQYAGDSIPYYGRMVIVSHDGGVASCYAQTSRLLVRKGQSVKRGQVIARSGDSGRGHSEPYLHFEIRKNGEAVNPVPYLP